MIFFTFLVVPLSYAPSAVCILSLSCTSLLLTDAEGPWSRVSSKALSVNKHLSVLSVEISTIETEVAFLSNEEEFSLIRTLVLILDALFTRGLAE